MSEVKEVVELINRITDIVEENSSLKKKIYTDGTNEVFKQTKAAWKKMYNGVVTDIKSLLTFGDDYNIKSQIREKYFTKEKSE